MARILSRLKALLRPLKPVLEPIRRQVMPFTEVAPVGQSAHPWKHALARRMRPIRALRRSEFGVVAVKFPYYRNRWDYMSVVCSIAGELITRDGLQSALELAPRVRPVIVGADVMGLEPNPDLQAEGQVITHDARQVPWPFRDRQYGLFVALEVFEHLGDSQNAAFQEVRRVARHAIIAVPIDWTQSDPTDIHHQISHERALAWFAPVTPTRVVEGNPAPNVRMIYVFENLQDAVASEHPGLAEIAQRIVTVAAWEAGVVAAGRAALARVAEETDYVLESRELGPGVAGVVIGSDPVTRLAVAARVAGRFDVQLYRVDLSAVASKYIGETEKHLRQLFDAAEAGGAVLFFDEADALFENRDEVGADHDRYASLGIDQLLKEFAGRRSILLLGLDAARSHDRERLRWIKLALRVR